jgi:hypothetical protein
MREDKQVVSPHNPHVKKGRIPIENFGAKLAIP